MMLNNRFSFFKKLSVFTVAVLPAVIVVTTNVQAEEKLEEIVVTAQFKEQSLQDAPVAITAFSGSMLEARSMTDIYQVAASAPNVTMTPAGSTFGSATVAYIRGIGQNDSSLSVEPGVGMYIDDVYHATLLGSMFDLLDLERVEVLRGPQGTLAGKNSIGGAVKLYSRKPDGEGGGYVEATVGEFNRIDLRAAAEFTLMKDTLFARFSGSSKQRDGYINRYDYGCLQGTPVIDPGTGQPIPLTNNSGSCKLGTEGGKDVQSFRAALRWLPTDSVEVNFAYDTTEDNSEAPGTVLSAVNPALSPVDPSFIPKDIYTSYSTYVNPFSGFRANNEARASSSGYALTVDWNISDKLSLKSITSYRELEAEHVQEDGTPLALQLNVYGGDTEAFTQEIRLNGVAFDDRFDWTIGAYYFDSDSTQSGRKDLPYINGGNGLYFVDDDKTTTESRSVFAHGIFALTDRMNLTAGIRYTDEDKTYEFARLNPDGTNHPLLGGLTGQINKYSGDQVDYRLVLDYQWTDDLMTYLQYSTGFKGGGISTRAFFPFQVDGFEPETVDAYEIGMKSSWLDNSLRLNLSAFFNDYSDKQLVLGACDFLSPPGFPPGLPCALFANAGAGEIKGLEAEIEWHASDNLLVDASASWLDFKYTEVGLSTGISKSDTLSFAPEVQANIGVQYDIRLANGSITPRLDVNYTSEFFTNSTNLPSGEVEAVTLVNARVTWHSANDDWQAALSITNLLDKEYFSNHLAGVMVNPGLGVTGSLPAPPRQWGISIKRSF